MTAWNSTPEHKLPNKKTYVGSDIKYTYFNLSMRRWYIVSSTLQPPLSLQEKRVATEYMNECTTDMCYEFRLPCQG
jgi:hypothetical protein